MLSRNVVWTIDSCLYPYALESGQVYNPRVHQVLRWPSDSRAQEEV